LARVQVGVELTQRTGINPKFQYLQVGCSKMAEVAMLEFARKQQGKPFSMTAMARSIVWPRQTTGKNYFCSELVAATLQAGGLLSLDVNPGSATPESLHRAYAKDGAAIGNPYTMRRIVRERASRAELQPLIAKRGVCGGDVEFGKPPRPRPEPATPILSVATLFGTAPLAVRRYSGPSGIDPPFDGYASAPPRSASVSSNMSAAERGIRNAVRRSFVSPHTDVFRQHEPGSNAPLRGAFRPPYF
jgi:hypothetical protein